MHTVTYNAKNIEIIYFDSAEEMLSYIKDGNDLFCPSKNQYVWCYNDKGSIAVAPYNEEDLIKKGHEMFDYNDNTLIFENLRGLIYDDPTYDGWDINKTTNLQFCEKNYKAGWINADEYIIPETEDDDYPEIDLGSITIDVKLTDNKYDVWISHDGNSGDHYTGMTADDIGRVISGDIDMYAESYGADVPINEKPALLIFTDGTEISYVTHKNEEAARNALKSEYQTNFSDLYKDIPENEISWEQEMSYCNENKAVLYTNDTIMIWQIATI